MRLLAASTPFLFAVLLSCSEGTRGRVLTLQAIVSTDAGVRLDAPVSLPDAMPNCTPMSAAGPLAEWNADGSLDSSVCVAWSAEANGSVDYGIGQTDQSWYFRSNSSEDESPDYVAITTAGEALLTPDGVSVDAWVRQTHFNDYPGSGRFIFRTQGNAMPWQQPGQVALYLHENGLTYFLIATGTEQIQGTDWSLCAFSLDPLTLNTWIRLTGTYDGQEIRCYVNGALASSVPLEFLGTAEMGTLIIGRSYPGDVDALRIFSRALAEDEVAQPWP